MKPATKRIAWAAGIIATLAIVGTVIGVVVVEVKKNRSSSSSSSDSPESNTSTTLSTTDSSFNPSTTTGTPTETASLPSITPNPALHKSFYGMAYTPTGAIMPECGANIDEVHRDIAILSQLTTRLRLYGSDCNVTSLVLQAIQDLNVDLKVFPAIYLEPEELSYTRQKTILENSLQTYGTENVLGVAVGNEYVLVSIQEGDTTENSTSRVVEKMNEVRTDLQTLGYDLPVGTSDAGGTVTQAMVDAADFVFANIHPWFSQNTAATAADFANNFMLTTLEPMAAVSSHDTTPVMYQGEYGWPSASDEVGQTNPAGDLPSVANLQTVLDDWVCSANAAGTLYFWFSAFDEPWKAIHGGVEPYWGLFDSDYNLKDIVIPACIA